MRSITTAALASAVLAIGCATVASAADLGARPVTKAPPPVVAPYNWTGLYIGGHVGGAWGTKDWTDVGVTPPDPLGSHDVSGLIAGGQVGFNIQSGRWVYGIEAQFSWADVDGSHTLGTTTLSTKIDWMGTIAGRLGYTWDRVLLYAKGGIAFVHDEHLVGTTQQFVFAAVTLPVGPYLAADETRWGWMVGAGIEVALAGNWSIKGEYNYMDFGRDRINFSYLPPLPAGNAPFNIDQQIHVVKFGINYRFGGGPIVARY